MPSDPRAIAKPGDVLADKYVVERVIGYGGMGVVVAARHKELQQRVAIKLLAKAHTKDPEIVERFLREARAVARLKSDHTVKVLDVARRKDGSPFIVMELLQGEDLGAVVERGPLPIPLTIDYLLQASEAIAEAHALGIVHRDLKPRNLFVAQRVGGRAVVKVLDFGIAKRVDMHDRALTATTAVMGSPQYMSPEQMKASRNVDFRTDIWSLGVCLYELLAGRVPWDSDAVPLLCAMVLKDPPPPLRHFRPELPEGLGRVIERCLAKEPSERISNVAELAAAIEPFGAAQSRGAAERIAAVLDQPPPSLASAPNDEVLRPRPDTEFDTRSAATFDSSGQQRGGGIVLAAIAGVIAALGILGVVLGAIAWQRRSVLAQQLLTQHTSSGASVVESGRRRELVIVPLETYPSKENPTRAPTSTAAVAAPPTPPPAPPPPAPPPPAASAQPPIHVTPGSDRL